LAQGLTGKEPKVAYDLVIADDSVAAYEAFTALFAQSSYHTAGALAAGTPARDAGMANRRRDPIRRRRSTRSWRAMRGSDLAATARKMQERVRNRSLGANAALVPPTNVALGPTCHAPRRRRRRFSKR